MEDERGRDWLCPFSFFPHLRSLSLSFKKKKLHSTLTSKNKSTANKGYSVVIVDPQPLAPWPNTYGVWCDEFEAMGLDDCLEFTWPRANVFLDSTEAGKRELRRPYGRVDRRKLKRR